MQTRTTAAANCFVTARICELDDGLYDLLLHCAECRSLDTITEWPVIAPAFEALGHDELLVVIISKCTAAVITYDEPTGQLQSSCTSKGPILPTSHASIPSANGMR